MTNPPHSVDEETLARWRADPKSIPEDMHEVAKSYGWRGPAAGWAPPFGPVPPPEPIDVANQNVIEYELEKLGLDINGANWVIAPGGNFTRVAFDLDPDNNPVPLGRAPWDRPTMRCIVKLERNEVSNADSRYICYIEVWDRRARRLVEAGRSVLDYEGPEHAGPGIDKDKYYWFQNEAVAENPYQAVRRALRELLGDGFAFGALDEQAAAEWGRPSPPTAAPPDATPPDGDAEPEMTPEEKRAYNEQRVDEMIETVEQDLPPEESWSGIDDEGNRTPPAQDHHPSAATRAAASSFFSGRWLIAAIIAGIVVAALLGFAFLGGGDDASEGVPAAPADSQPADSQNADSQPAGGGAEQPAPSTEARTPDGQVPELPAGWVAPPPFDRADTDVEDPTVRWSSGGALWAWNVWQEPELISELEEVDADFAVSQLTTIPAGTAIPNELVISVDCSSDPCTYSTIQGAVAGDVDRRVTVPLTLNGLELTGDYVPAPGSTATPTAADQACTRAGTYRLEVTDLTVINNRLVPDFIRGERTLTTTCREGGPAGPIEYVLNETIEIHGRYLFRGSYADQ